MAESGDRRSKIPKSCECYAKELQRLNAFWDEIYSDSTKNNFEALTRLFKSFPSEEEIEKNDEKYVELENLLKYLVTLMNGYDEQMTSVNNHLQNMVHNISV